MQTLPQHSFQIVRTSYKSGDLTYEEPGYKLIVNLEGSAKRKFDWIACDLAFKKWTEPRGEFITDAHREKILQRLAEWSERQKVRIGFSPPLDLEKFARDAKASGWTVEKRDGGVTAFRSPVRRSIADQFRSLFGMQKRKSDQPTEPHSPELDESS